METAAKTYKFIGKVLPDGHLSIPEDVAKDTGSEFEVLLTPVDDIKKLISLYMEGRLERTGRFEDILFHASEIEQAVNDAFGTTDVDVLIDMIRR
jgi:hypothetical protein